MSSEDGPSRGVRVLEFRTGTGFGFEIGVERGFDVGRADYRGASLGWMPPTLMPGPWYFEDQANFGWLRAGLGGFNNTCGFIHIGNPEETSVAHYNFPARPTERYGVHDRAALIPAELLSFGGRWDGERYVLEAVGRITQAQTYGENLVVTRTYRSELGASWFTMEDVVENAGFLPTEHMLLYHINAGYPFVDEGSELIAPVRGAPKLLFGEADVRDRTSWSRFIAPQKNWIQQTFQHDMVPDENGEVEVAIFNPRLLGGTALSVRYDHRVMPNYIEWRMMGEGQYAVGIEPCTNGFGRKAVAESGQLIVLQPGERRTYRTTVSILSNEEAGKLRDRTVAAA
ncbi:MAG: DUF4432 family protein [Mesorhizobium sp.]|nr:DUF4432 family protein [Mesorhizobium sp.]MBL8580323.1 DUF4432 family protein [Mesorhizobium sp.]